MCICSHVPLVSLMLKLKLCGTFVLGHLFNSFWHFTIHLRLYLYLQKKKRPKVEKSFFAGYLNLLVNIYTYMYTNYLLTSNYSNFSHFSFKCLFSYFNYYVYVYIYSRKTVYNVTFYHFLNLV